uniref:ADF-H domain-containing protein n=1 Tax=Hucho hucho TaxID=62062 RepID=A0A4W5PDY1_9TELE
MESWWCLLISRSVSLSFALSFSLSFSLYLNPAPLSLVSPTAGGVVELSEKFLIAKPQYGLCRVGSAEVGGPRIAMICWAGPNVDENRRTECASHVPAIKTFFKEAYVFISAESKEDVTEEKICAELNKVCPPTEHVRRSSRSKDKETVVSGPLAIPSLSTRGGANTWTHPGTVLLY